MERELTGVVTVESSNTRKRRERMAPDEGYAALQYLSSRSRVRFEAIPGQARTTYWGVPPATLPGGH